MLDIDIDFDSGLGLYLCTYEGRSVGNIYYYIVLTIRCSGAAECRRKLSNVDWFD